MSGEPAPDFASVLRQLRAAAGLTQEELAQAAGLSPRTVSDLERGISRTARKRTTGLLADGMGLTGPVRVRFVAAARGRAAVAGLAGEVPARPQPAIRVARQLPADTGRFTGRAAELGQLDGALGTSPARTLPITVITGTAGAGKTALAVHWAHQVAGRFPDGQLYVNLRGYDSEDPVRPGTVLGSFLRALGMAGPAIPAGTQDRAAAYRSLLADRAVLVLLDNAASAEQARPLLPAGPSCAALVTSRDSLAGLIARDGAAAVALDLLPRDDAVALLTGLIGERAAADPGAVARLAACCCRLPLALRVTAELATARPGLPLAVLAGELEQRQRHLDLLEAGGDRRTAVREVFSWSVRRLDPAAARGFAVAALHPGPDLDAWALAAMTSTGPPEADRVLRHLARTGLVQSVGTSRYTMHRYTMHDLLRAFGRELAGDTGGIDAPAALTGLLGYLQSAAAVAVDVLYPAEAGQRPRMPVSEIPLPPLADEQAARAWLDAERETLIALASHAADDGWPGQAVSLAGIVHPYLAVGGYFTEAVAVHASALRAAELAGDSGGQAGALIHLGHIYRRQSRYQPALRCFARALDLARRTAGPLTECQALFGLAIVHHSQGRYPQAARNYQQILDLGRSAGSQYLQIRGLFGLGGIALDTGQYPQAARQLQQTADICRATGERIVLAPTLTNLGYLHLLQGRYREATEQFEESVAICRDTGNHVNGALAACQLALAGLRQGQYQRPEAQLRESLALFRANGHQNGEAWALIYLGELQLRTGRGQDARQDLEQALLICGQTGELPLLAEALNLLGEVFLALGDPAQARARHHDALALASQIGDSGQQSLARRGLGAAEAALGHDAEAGRPQPSPELTAGQEPARGVQLSVREQALLTAYVSGMTLDAAARHVGIRPATAKTYLRRVKVKYQAIGRPAYTKVELARRVWEETSPERMT